ncbi:MAG: hypothetical protein HWD89_05525 [Tenacibaculum sp.]|uniref:hypothetical protein n=1 Tax=unclassified Tenacibaculum TaxID=2635139 RepID=UPI0017B5D3E2|nr:hypothetical protein [Tenacibaculum sp.]NVK08492.1 hypothetical protein [Tenacibaculum sp.]
MNHNIRIKIGSIEIEYEGTEDYLKNDLPSLIDKLVALKGIPMEEPATESNNGNDENANDTKDVANNTQLQMSINSISAKLNVKSGSDLIIAACAHLVLVQNRETFQRQDILNEMKKASNYFKSSHRGNLTTSLKTLVTNHKLIERKTGTYALPATTLKSLKSTLNA